MIGKLDPEENVMSEDNMMYPGKMLGELAIALEKLGWEYGDDVTVDIGGCSISGIDGLGTKWSPVKGTVKYNKDAFIVIKNKSRDPFLPSVNDDPERLAHHLKQPVETVRESVDSKESSEQRSGTT